MMEWLLSPIDPGRAHDISALVAWHGRTMVLGWGLLVPVGILGARFLKITPWQDWPRELDNKLWWNTHRLCQYTSAALTLAGLALVMISIGGARLGGLHATLGWAIILLTTAQILGGLLRGSKGGPTDPRPDGSLHGDHYNMTTRRLVFEYVHKFTGYLALGLGCAAIASGLWNSNAPRWMWLLLGVWWAALLALGILLQARGHMHDTYQAIWGPDKIHPGNGARHGALRT
jgi:hypothetical protein